MDERIYGPLFLCTCTCIIYVYIYKYIHIHIYVSIYIYIQEAHGVISACWTGVSSSLQTKKSWVSEIVAKTSLAFLLVVIVRLHGGYIVHMVYVVVCKLGETEPFGTKPLAALCLWRKGWCTYIHMYIRYVCRCMPRYSSWFTVDAELSFVSPLFVYCHLVPVLILLPVSLLFIYFLPFFLWEENYPRSYV